jgi:CRISPR/Cas system-associated exonuclease Cas4 (RecB family)
VDVAIPAHLTWGQADGIVIIDGEKYVLEIKSANPNTFNSLNSKPPVYYLPQINLYMHGLGIFQTIFLFENKATQEIKEIRYRYDSKVLKPIFEKTSVAVKHIKAKKMPPRLKSPTEVKEHCRLCEYRQICGLTDDFKEKLRVRDYAK